MLDTIFGAMVGGWIGLFICLSVAISQIGMIKKNTDEIKKEFINTKEGIALLNQRLETIAQLLMTKHKE